MADGLKVWQVLERAKELWSRGHCVRAVARDRDGVPVPATSKDAVTWCGVGAIYRACADLWEKDQRTASEQLNVYEFACKLLSKQIKFNAMTFNLAEFSDQGKLTTEHWNLAIVDAKAHNL